MVKLLLMKKGRTKNVHKSKNLRKKRVSKAKSRGIARNSKKGSRNKRNSSFSSARTIPEYRIARIERYYGDMKAYVFKSKNNKKEFSPIYSQKNQQDFKRLLSSLKKKVLNSPVPYSKVKIIQLAIEGVAKVTHSNGEENEFPFWKASVKSVKNCNKKIFFAALIDREKSLKRKLEDFANEGEKMEYAGTESNTAEEYYLESMRIYAELPKSDTNKKTKSKKAKNSRRRH